MRCGRVQDILEASACIDSGDEEEFMHVLEGLDATLLDVEADLTALEVQQAAAARAVDTPGMHA